MEKTFLLYGANGYTGELIARFAADRDLKPVLAGRNEPQIAALAEKFDMPYRIFSLDETEKMDAALRETEFVLHCAGPFSLTSEKMVAACLRNKKHYLDITGEIAVFEAMAARDAQAKQAGIMIMPGVGFDVVPSDCLAKHLKNRLPTADRLTLAFHSAGKISHGTQTTMVLNMGNGGAVRRDGTITQVPAGWKTRKIDFGDEPKTAVTIPWGDVATAFYSTGIPNIEVYTVVPESNLVMLKMSRWLGWLMKINFIKNTALKNIPKGGPTDDERAKTKTFLWGEASDKDGNRVETKLQTMEAYTLTALTALAISEKILSGSFCAGFQTPAKCYGADLIMEINGVRREDVQ